MDDGAATIIVNDGWLQWVHGPQTVVMAHGKDAVLAKDLSFNGSTVLRPWLCGNPLPHYPDVGRLQWVHGPQTVVMNYRNYRRTD